VTTLEPLDEAIEPGHTEAEFRARHMMVTWVGEENRGELRRIGLEATARINRHDFGVSWQDETPGGGVVVSNEIELVLDVEAILLDDLERTGAIDYHPRARYL
jgi:polyisoprenoid-binding protein YceI